MLTNECAARENDEARGGIHLAFNFGQSVSAARGDDSRITRRSTFLPYEIVHNKLKNRQGQ